MNKEYGDKYTVASTGERVIYISKGWPNATERGDVCVLHHQLFPMRCGNYHEHELSKGWE